MSAHPLAMQTSSNGANALQEALDNLSSALSLEAELLVAGPPERFADAVAAKRRALKTLESLAKDQRTRAVLEGGDAPDALIAQLRACRQQNLASGDAIARARQTNDRVLRFLGQIPVVSGYAEDGQVHAPAFTRPLGSA
jgi:flagellar biosynthesis/type III secretory pathway chaperone